MLGPSGLGCFCTWTAETYMGVGAGVQGLGLGLFEVEPNIQSRSERKLRMGEPFSRGPGTYAVQTVGLIGCLKSKFGPMFISLFR